MMMGVIQTLPSTRFVCVRTSFSTNFWWSLFLLFEWIHPSIDLQCSHADTDYMTPETLYENEKSSLNMDSPVLLSVTPSTNVSIQVAWGSFIISGVKAPWASSFKTDTHLLDSLGVDHALAHCYTGTISSFVVLVRRLRRHSLSLDEALALCISIVFSTQIHSIVCMTSNHHQVAFFRYIRCCKKGLLVTLHHGAYYGLHW